jgi:PAS domain-containing protein
MLDNNNISEFAGDPDFLKSINNSLTQALCVVNDNLEIEYCNDRFAELFGQNGKNLQGKQFGASIGCKGYEHNYAGAICNNCKLRLSMQAAMVTGQDQENETIVLQMSRSSKEEIMLIQYHSFFLKYADKKFAVVVLNDLTNMGKETLEFINRFYEERI